MRRGDIMDHCYEALANAIITQAVDDYRRALRVLFFYPHHRDAKRLKTEVLRFLRSDWFRLLSATDPETLIRRLNEEGTK